MYSAFDTAARFDPAGYQEMDREADACTIIYRASELSGGGRSSGISEDFT